MSFEVFKRNLSIAVFLGFFLVLTGGAQSAAAVTLTVTKTADTFDGTCDADCSLREALAAIPAGGTIQFSALFNTPQTITITGSFNYLNVARSMTITGPGADKLTVSGSHQTKLFSVQPGATVTISGLTVTNGDSGGSTGNAGGIDNFGNLTIDRCIIRGNTGTSYAGGIGNFSGGSLTVIGSTIADNSTNLPGSSSGGGISSDGVLTVLNSTVSGNSAGANSISGGGVLIFGGSATITNCTITNNSTTTPADRASGIFIFNFFSNGPVALRNNIVAGNVNNALIPDVARYTGASGAFTSLGSNLIGNADGETAFVAAGDQTGTGAAPLDPRLAPLGLYGGIFPTHALLQTSAAINAGVNCVTDLSCAANNPPNALTTDQRGSGAPRKIGAFVDIGAFEQNVTFAANTAPNGLINTPYSFQINAVRQTGFAAKSEPGESFAPTSFSIIPIAGQGLPPNLTLSAGGLIAGVPTSSGSFTVTVLVTDTDGFSGAIRYRINILVPTAAGVTVAGRVLTSSGRAASSALVSLTDGAGVVRTARTNSFGVYRFENVRAGETYILQAVSKGSQSAAQIVAVTGDINEMELTLGAK